ncbi:MAG TPA: hypothetical protein VEU96_29240 [Bryobacteraceae bacterium]|nr:hypothetical protein [Bryobacteraceae bacterium]
MLFARYLLPAIAFGLSGALSAWLLTLGNDGPWLWGWPIALPFAAVSVALWVRSFTPALIIVILDALAWQAGFRTAIALAGLGEYAAVCIGGFVGAAGVVASMGLIRRELLSQAGWAALLGAVTAAPFGLWLRVDSGASSGSHLPLLIMCFAVWQIAIGLFLQYHYSRSRG